MKKFFACIVALILCLSLSFPAFADYMIEDDLPMSEESSEIQPLAEETEWFVRINNGMIEKRLWSYTYGKWLTDWIVVGPAPEG